MLRRYSISNDEIIPVCVMATMSSGKSTFLNAILGESILPEKNEACTARALSVLNQEGVLNPIAYICKEDGKKFAVDLYFANTVARINSDESVTDVLIVKEIESLENTNKSIVLIDTPGVNNSGDIRHAERTKEILNQLKKGVIVYLLNATQLATHDDELLLQMVIEHINANQNVKIIFVINKIDMLDEDKESISSTIENAMKYIEDHGLKDIDIYPLSALSAKTFRMVLNGKRLTKAEERHMKQSYTEYEDSSTRSMLQYAHSYNKKGQDFFVGEKRVSEYELRRAIENTGIVEIERAIQKTVIAIDQVQMNWTSVFSEYADLEGFYSQKRKSRNYENYTGKAHWICKKCRQINGLQHECLHCKAPNIRLRKQNGL